MRAEHVGSETLLARIVQMVSQAQRSRAPIQRLADRIAAWFVPAVIAVAVLTFIVWSLFGPAAAPGPRIGECRCRSHHRLSMRVGIGHSHGDHGRHRTRRSRWCPHQEC